MNTEHERIKFEAACHRHAEEAGHEGAAKLERDGDGYADPATQAAWWGWREGRAALQSQDREGWKEAAIAWEVCASLHREYCKGKDPLFTTRQGDFVRHAAESREKALSPCSTEDKTDAERYRWLRDSALLFSQIEQPGVSGWMVGRRDHVKTRFYTYNGKELDEAIDHARRAEGEL